MSGGLRHRLFQVPLACGSGSAGGWPGLWLTLLVVIWGLLQPVSAAAQATAAASAPKAAAAATGFDHLSTGFALTGRHAQTACEGCHQNGVLRGTPRDCASCHQSGQRFARGNVVMSASHLPTQQACDSCHGTRSFSAARFSHAGVAAGSCASCHNGMRALGKPATPAHANATACDACHSTTSWAGAKVDHRSFTTATTCAGCHSGSSATGKPAQHVPVGSANCAGCHGTQGWKPSSWNHGQLPVSGQCAACHSGAYPPADGRPANHLPYASVAALAGASCDSCHKAGFTAWLPAKVHRSVVLGTACASCHSGAFAQAVGKPDNAVHATVNGNCESCHKSTSSWAGAKVDHASLGASTLCAGCHNGSAATGKSSTHMPVGSANCASCHATAAWTPSQWTHAQLAVTGQCASCHSGGFPPADGRPANHIPYAGLAATASANCDSCHKGSFSSWANGRLHANVSVSGQCDSCHTGGFLAAVGKPGNALHAGVSGNCESCHKSTSRWGGTKVNHSSFNDATACASCHNGSSAGGKPSGHVPVGAANCFSCHGTSAWLPSKWNHTQVGVAAQCASCHSGGYPPADGRPANHIPYQSVPITASANCDSCHKGSTSTWANGKLHSNFSISTGCASCHTGAFLQAVGKPGTPIHAQVSGHCEGCHKSTSTWSAKVDHASFNDTTHCASCHNGSTATGKPATHMPVGAANCFSCHGTSGWLPSKWNHTQVVVAAQCASCHSGGYPPADGRPANHIPYQSVPITASANCDSCHKGSTSTWANGRLHSNFSISAGCASCHTGSYLNAVGKPNTAIHATVTGNCESCHKSAGSWGGARVEHSSFSASTNCVTCHNGGAATGKPTTHMPVGAANCVSCHGTGGWLPSAWSHTQVAVAGQCASCHSGGYPPADGRPANHIPYQAVPITSAANCDSCHKGSTSTWANGKLHASFSVSTGCASCHTGTFLNAVGKPNNATHASITGNCESCHKSTSSWSGAKVDHTAFNASTNCAGCHNGSGATGKPATHMPVGAANCFSCHGTTGWVPSKWNHTQMVVTAQCASCHSGGYPPADGRPANHIPYQAVPITASANCDSCHKGSTASWANGKLHSNFSISSGCASCHTGSYLNAVGKPATPVHATVTGNCESCHKSTSTWSAKVDHATFNDTTNCASCHNGSTATGKPATHIPVGATNCFSCHGTTGWVPSKWNHTQMVVTAQCATCHSGGYPPADGRPANHIPYQSVPVSAAANCDSCHKGSTTTWANGKFHSNFSVSTSCASCHTGTYLNAVGKPNTAVHATVTGNCESCHKSTSTWSAKVDHSSYNDTTNCASCHNGSTATGKPATHIPVGATNCFSCHGTTGWVPSKWNHTQMVVTAQCASCHSGGYPPADGRPANHIPYQSVPVSSAANCDSCHKGSTSTWANGKFHSNFSVSTGCFSCHTGSYLNAVGKPNNATHASITGNCESCHKSTSSWTQVNFTHSPANAVGTGTCDTCHNGSTATGKPATHIPVPTGAARCDSCHKSQASWTSSVAMNHGAVTGGLCKSCHNGSYLSEGSQGALAKPSNHIPESQLLNGAAMDCNACHTSTSSWGSQKMNHNNSQGNGAGWCKACHQSGTNYMGGMERKALTHEKSTGVTDCSQSGCHRPLGNKGSAYTKWD